MQVLDPINATLDASLLTCPQYSRAEDMASAGASGRKDLDDKSPQSKSQPKKSSAYDDNFEVILLEHDIFMELHQFPDDRMAPEPVNLEEVLKFVSRQRDSPSLEDFSKSNFLSFRRVNIATAEATIMVNVIPTIVGPPKAGNECGMVFTNLKSMTEGLTVRPVPDLFDGAQYGDVNIRIRRDLNEQIIPAKRASAPVLPNLFLEAKAGSGGADVARRQACYDGAYGARAMHALQNYGRAEGERVFDNMAYTYSAIYHAGASSLQIYAHHVASGPEGKPEYYMTKVCGFDMTNSMDTFIQGASAFRNARDLAKLHRDAFIKAANARAVKPAASAIAKGKRRAVAGDSGSDPAMQEPNCAQEVSVPTDEGEDEMAAARKGAKRLRRSASPEPGPANKKR